MSESDAPDSTRLEDLLKIKEHDSYKRWMGSFEIFWGGFNTLGIWIYELVWPDKLFWAFWVPAGALMQVSLATYWMIRKGRSDIIGTALVRIWAFALLCLPLFIAVFPALNLYDTERVFPVVMVWIGLTALATGVFVLQVSQFLSAAVFLLSAPVFCLWSAEYAWIFTGVNLFGLILPGWLNLHEKRG